MSVSEVIFKSGKINLYPLRSVELCMRCDTVWWGNLSWVVGESPLFLNYSSGLGAIGVKRYVT